MENKERLRNIRVGMIIAFINKEIKGIKENKNNYFS